MILKKILPISKVIVSPRDICGIISRIHEEFRKSDGTHKTFRVKLTDLNATQYEFIDNDLDFQNILKKLEERNICDIGVYFTDYTKNKDIDFDLKQEVFPLLGFSKINISGSQEAWVNGMAEALKEIIAHWQRQMILNWPIIYFVFFFLCVVFIISCSIILIRLFHQTYNVASLLIMPAMLFAWYITNEIAKTFPIIELLTGPEHMQWRRKRKNRLYFILVVIVIPILINFLTIYLSPQAK